MMHFDIEYQSQSWLYYAILNCLVNVSYFPMTFVSYGDLICIWDPSLVTVKQSTLFQNMLPDVYYRESRWKGRSSQKKRKPFLCIISKKELLGHKIEQDLSQNDGWPTTVWLTSQMLINLLSNLRYSCH